MAAINLSRYFSQWDGDTGGATGACGETCLKMIDNYLTGREVAISDIIKNGDNDPRITSIAGMQKAAAWLGYGVDYYYDVREADIMKWLSEGKLIVAVLKYGLFPSKYKQDLKYQSGHFVVITGITDDGKAIRFADPNFWGNQRNDGWMDNNKWASYGDFYLAFYHNDGNISRNGAVLVSKKGKLPTPPAPPEDPCSGIKKELDQCKSNATKLEGTIHSLESQNNALSEQVKTVQLEAGALRDQAIKLTGQVTTLTEEKGKLQSQLTVTAGQLTERDEQIKVYKIKQLELETKVTQLTSDSAEKDGEIFTLTEQVEKLKQDAVKKMTLADAVLFILNKLSGKIR